MLIIDGMAIMAMAMKVRIANVVDLVGACARSLQLCTMHTGPANTACTWLQKVFLMVLINSSAWPCLNPACLCFAYLVCGPYTFYRLDTLIPTETGLR